MANFPTIQLSDDSVADIIQQFLDAVKPYREVIINDLDDWPAAVGGVITLEANTQYLIGDNLPSSTDRFVLSNFTVVKGIDGESGNIDYTGTGVMFTSTNVSFLIEDITLDCPNGTIFNHTDNSNRFVQLHNVQVADANVLGSFSSNGGVWFATRFLVTAMTDGLTFLGSWNILQLEIASDVQIQGTFIDLGSATFNSVGIQGASIFLVTSGSLFISGLANSANINAGGLGRVTNCVVNNLGGSAILQNISPDDTRWRFLNNQDIADTRPDILATFIGNVAETVIAATSTPVKVNSNLWALEAAAQFTLATDGRATFIGEIPQRLPIDAIIDVQMAGGGGLTDLTVCIAINGSVVTNSCFPINDVSNTRVRSGATLWQYMFTEGDYVEIFITNESNTTNVIVTQAVLRIN